MHRGRPKLYRVINAPVFDVPALTPKKDAGRNLVRQIPRRQRQSQSQLRNVAAHFQDRLQRGGLRQTATLRRTTTQRNTFRSPQFEARHQNSSRTS